MASGQLSELAVFVEKMNKQNRPGSVTHRNVMRGASGSMGSRLFQGRNSDAGLNKERQLFESPILKAMMFRMQTPITDYLKGVGF